LYNAFAANRLYGIPFKKVVRHKRDFVRGMPASLVSINAIGLFLPIGTAYTLMIWGCGQ